MLISIVAWMLRFGLFAFGDPTPFGTVLLVLSMIVYGCAFDFFNISGSVFVEKEVRPEIRASARDVPDDDQRLRLHSWRDGERQSG